VEGKVNCYRVCEGGEAQRTEAVARCVCLRPEPLAGIYSHEDGMVDISEYAKASPINGKGSAVLPVPRENATIDDREGI